MPMLCQPVKLRFQIKLHNPKTNISLTQEVPTLDLLTNRNNKDLLVETLTLTRKKASTVTIYTALKTKITKQLLQGAFSGLCIMQEVAW